MIVYYIYEGNAHSAWKLFDLTWPKDVEGKDQFLKEFNAGLAKSDCREDVKKMIDRD